MISSSSLHWIICCLSLCLLWLKQISFSPLNFSIYFLGSTLLLCDHSPEEHLAFVITQKLKHKQQCNCLQMKTTETKQAKSDTKQLHRDTTAKRHKTTTERHKVTTRRQKTISMMQNDYKGMQNLTVTVNNYKEIENNQNCVWTFLWQGAHHFVIGPCVYNTCMCVLKRGFSVYDANIKQPDQPCIASLHFLLTAPILAMKLLWMSTSQMWTHPSVSTSKHFVKTT